MPSEPSREAREAWRAMTSQFVDDMGEGRAVMGDAEDYGARALDDFAEELREELKTVKGAAQAQRREVVRLGDMLRQWKKRYREEQSRASRLARDAIEVGQERDALRKQIRAALIAINTDAVTDLTCAQDGTLRMAIQAHASGVKALRRRVAELEAEGEAVKRLQVGSTGLAVTNGEAFLESHQSATDWKARAEAAEGLLDQLAGNQFVRAQLPGLVQEIEEARRARGDG